MQDKRDNYPPWTRPRAISSRIFTWYARDFGATQAERLRFLAPYFYNESDRGFISERIGMDFSLARSALVQGYDMKEAQLI